MKKRFSKTLLALGIVTMLMMPFTAINTTALAAAAATKIIAADSTWEINETTNLTSLAIGRRASITAPKGYSVTLTVDGIGTPVKYGSYKGKIALTVTKDITMKGGGPSGGFLGGAAAGGGAPAASGAPAAGGAAPAGGGGPGRSSKPFRSAVYIENGKYITEKSVAAAG
jgi:hypothetical protein